MEAKDAALEGLELALKAFIEKAYEPASDEVLKKIKDLIPGEQFDGLAELLVEAVKPTIKAALLAQVDKISDKV